ncbi:hypothetical protein [Flavobacterium sp. HNIBRBA15423]|uniref:hypothetical protein n=1 Tax=Flavobacterium sp. HNIBRBA15423 TaxID=3458683 RepID=UPI0040450725
MKKAIYSLAILLLMSFVVISYLTTDLTTEKEKFFQEDSNHKIVLLGEGNSYNPILIIKKD